MNNYFTSRKMRFLLLFLSLVLAVSACGKNISSSPASNSLSSNAPLGMGTTPEPGTNGKSMPLPDGHFESMVASNGIDFVGSDNGRLYALNGKDGSVRWHHNAGAPVSVVAVIDGTVYANANNGDGNSGVVYAFNASDGRVLWHYNINDYISQLLVENGIVYAGTAATGNSIRLYALQASSGSLLWSYSARAETPGLLTAGDGAVFYAEILGIVGDSFNERITALRSSNGSLLWHLPIAAADGFARGTPALSNGVFYIGTNSGSVYAVRVSDGSVLWHVARSGGFDGIPLDLSPLVDNGMVFMEGKQGPGGQHVMFFAMRASDGTLLWSKSQGVEPGPMVNQPQIVGGVIYASDGAGGLSALRETDGAVLWQHTGDQVSTPVIVVDGRVQLDSGETVLAISSKDGAVLWRRAISFHNVVYSNSTPEAEDSGIVYVATTNGAVQALSASDGHTLWQYVIQELAVPTDPIYGAYVHFSSGVSFQQAIHLLTDLGLQTVVQCAVQWKPQGSGVGFSTDPWLVAIATVNSAPLWFNRLQTVPEVAEVQASGPHSCPMMRYDPKAPGLLQPDAPVTYVKATFANSTGYDTALEAVNNLGFRLANPCYEQARARGDKPTWNTAGQENIFGSAHKLLLATTTFNATTWLSQLKSLAGVTNVDEPVAVAC
ncbi:MAG TPA: PQQ-binding-like beta-propeller repeat protein [Ktedonobacteraceae bacterium]|nr:PQQ-binding-like beta-propeller repeat protein [Ktedonobacteraceae bacterium]